MLCDYELAFQIIDCCSVTARLTRLGSIMLLSKKMIYPAMPSANGLSCKCRCRVSNKTGAPKS
jgi:hypothetical protein